MSKKNRGSTFVEIIIVIAIVVIVITALISGSIASLRRVDSNTLKSQATKYAEEGIELTRKERDTSWNAFSAKSSGSGTTWCVGEDASSLALWQAAPCSTKNIKNLYTRKIILITESSDKINVTVDVSWNEGIDVRNSTIRTYLTNWR